MFRLYESEGCHLCDQAKQLLADTPIAHLGCELIDIAEHEELVERFGHHIPVLEHAASQQLLYWPFDEISLARWYNALAQKYSEPHDVN